MNHTAEPWAQWITDEQRGLLNAACGDLARCLPWHGGIRRRSCPPPITEFDDAPSGAVRAALRHIHCKLRDSVDEIDLEAMEQTA